MKHYKLYIVGGYVRDKLLGLKIKVDYAFEFDEDFIKKYKNLSPSRLLYYDEYYVEK